MKKNVLVFTFALLLGFSTVSTLNANNKIEALANNVESLQNKLSEVENDTNDLKIETNKLGNETSEIKSSLVDETSKLNLRIEKIEN